MDHNCSVYNNEESKGTYELHGITFDIITSYCKIINICTS